MKAQSHRSRPLGIAMAETVIAIPVALILLIGAGEVGRAFWQYNTLSKSVRDAARFAAEQAMPGSAAVVNLSAGVVAQVQNLVVYGNPNGAGTPVLQGLTTSDVSVETPGEEDVLVRGTYAYTPVFGVIPDFNGGGWATSFNFEAVVRMRAL